MTVAYLVKIPLPFRDGMSTRQLTDTAGGQKMQRAETKVVDRRQGVILQLQVWAGG